VSPENKARKPCVRLFMTSISCKETVWTTSFRFCNSPSGHWTNLVYETGLVRQHMSFLQINRHLANTKDETKPTSDPIAS
jgi:hypothetical protein